MHSFIIGLAFFAILPTELDATNDDEDKTPKNKGVRISTEPEDIVYNVNSQNFRDAVFRLTSAPQQQTSSSKRSASSPTASGGGGGDAIKVPKFDGTIAAVPSQPSLAPNALAWMVPLAQQQQQQAVGQLQDNATTLGTTASAASAEGINVSKRKHSATEFGGNSKNMKMKGPLKAESEETIDGRLPAVAELQIAAEKALLRLDNSNLETQVFRILELSMWAIDFTFMGLNFVRTIQRNLTGLYKKLGKKFKKMNAKSVTKQLKGLLLDNELAKKNPIFSDIFEQIEAQIVNVFGHNPFKMEEDEQKNLIGIMPAEQSKSAENNSKMHGVLLFFYARLFRKLAGLLEAPYKSPINPTKPQLSHREAQLIWITVAREIIAKQFPIDQHPVEFHLIAKFDEFDTVPEQLLLAEMSIKLTICPFSSDNLQNFDLVTFVQFLDYIMRNNLACFIFAKFSYDLKQIPESILADGSNSGVAVTFLRLFIASIRQHYEEQHNGQNVDTFVRNADIYKKIYANLLKLLPADSKALIKAYKHLVQSQSPEAVQLIQNFKMLKKLWNLSSAFLTNGIVQLDAFIDKWKTMTASKSAFSGTDVELMKMNFLKANCPQFIQ